MMRKKNIGEETFKLLKNNNISQAIDLFNQECDVLLVCPHSQNKSKCTSMCLIPKLNFLEIRDSNIGINKIIDTLKKI
ncbi:MAG: hypothetical protein P8J14_10680 [Emcibacteraceae bacterium]|nr:hypothetical protein [Emcibacteraceae bacterium]